jgi:hypothetical protein
MFVLTLTMMRRRGVAALAVLLTATAIAACTSGSTAGGPTTAVSSQSPSDATTPPPQTSADADAPESMPVSASALGDYVQGGAALANTTYQQGASQSGQPMRPTAGITEFSTPSGNISCGMTGAADTVSLACDVSRHAYAAPPKPASCHLNWGAGWLSIDAEKVVQGLCLGGPPFDPVSSVLPYGSTLRHGSLACRSESAFLACADLTSGHGFAVNRTTLKTY